MDERRYLEFERSFESKFLSQDAYENRTIQQSLDICWDLLEMFPETDLKQISDG